MTLTAPRSLLTGWASIIYIYITCYYNHRLHTHTVGSHLSRRSKNTVCTNECGRSSGGSGTPSSTNMVNRPVRRACVVGGEGAQGREERLHSRRRCRRFALALFPTSYESPHHISDASTRSGSAARYATTSARAVWDVKGFLCDFVSRRETRRRVDTYLPCPRGHVVAVCWFWFWFLGIDVVSWGHAKNS